MLYHILTAAGFKVGLLSTINFRIGDQEFVNESKKTSLGAYGLNKTLRQMVQAECDYVIIETSSHGLHQGRLNNIDFIAGAFTNLSHEHLDYHQTMNKYAAEKFKLLQKADKNQGNVALNGNDHYYEQFDKNLNKATKNVFSLEEPKNKNKQHQYFYSKNILPNKKGGLSFDLISPSREITIQLNLLGEFNIENALLASSLAYGQEVSLNNIKQGLEQLQTVPGRMQTVYNGDFRIIIDYALTPDSLEKMYSNLKKTAEGKIIAVFGSCGDRDRTKRPIMTKIVSTYVDYIILTNEDPYTEDPLAIIKELEKGLEFSWMSKDKDYFLEIDRKKAIAKACALAKKNDLVMVTGKGAETMMMIGDQMVPWSDKGVIEEVVTEMGL